MHIRVITPPEPVVTLVEAKAHLRVFDTFQDEVIESYIAAATGWLDGPDGWLGRCLGAQVLELTDCAFGNDRLPLPPAIEIVSIVYTDPHGQEQTMAPGDYRLLHNGSIWADTWPALGSAPDAVRIQWRAGYPSGIPTPIKHAILLLVGQWWTNRSAVNVGNIVNEMPFSVEALLAPYRVWR